MKYTLKIVADYNDADYVTSENTVDEQEVSEIRRIANIIKGCPDRHNWDTTWRGNVSDTYKDVLTGEEIEWFGDHVPTAPNHDGIHTIVNISIVPKIEWERLL